jgi:hypothetical protein
VDTYGTHTGKGMGSTTSSTHGSLQQFRPHSFNCPIYIYQPGGQDNTTPSITNVSPSRGLIGATTSSVTITGTGLSGAFVNVPSTMSYSNLDYVDNQHITLNLTISSGATAGNNASAIYVTNTGQNSNKKDFYVQVPTSLSMITPKTGSEGLCHSGAWCGTSISFEYQVNDQDSPPQPILAAMSAWDSFGVTSPDPLNIDKNGGYYTTCQQYGLAQNAGPCQFSTNGSGVFTEGAVGGCSQVCISNGACTTNSSPSVVSQTWHIFTAEIVQQISIYCQKVLVNGQ